MYVSLSFWKMVPPDKESGIDHVNLATYEYEDTVPWIPPKGSFFRFRDFRPPGKPIDHTETAGWIEDVVTCVYSATRMTIEVYIRPRSEDPKEEQGETRNGDLDDLVRAVHGRNATISRDQILNVLEREIWQARKAVIEALGRLVDLQPGETEWPLAQLTGRLLSLVEVHTRKGPQS